MPDQPMDLQDQPMSMQEQVEKFSKVVYVGGEVHVDVWLGLCMAAPCRPQQKLLPSCMACHLLRACDMLHSMHPQSCQMHASCIAC